jgi:hypothetical protein
MEVTLWIEAIRPSGKAGDETVKVEVDPDGTGAAKFMAADQVRLTNTQLAFVSDGAGNGAHVVDDTDPVAGFARIGHWGADTVFPAGAPGGEGTGVDGYRPDGTVRNNAATAGNGWDNFVDRDPDRFYIRVDDPTRNLDSGTPDEFLLTIGTRLESGAVDDDQTQVKLVETGNDTGVFISKSQLLMSEDVSDNADDDFAVNDGTTGPVADDTLGDRSHRATLDGSVRVELGGVSRQVPVGQRGAADERRTLRVQVNIFNEPFIDGNGNSTYDAGESFMDISAGARAFGVGGVWGPIWTNAEVDRMLTYMRAYWESAAIRIVEVGRQNIAPTGALFNQAGTAGYFDDFPDDVTNVSPSRDETIIQNNFRSAVNLNGSTDDDVVDMYFVAPFTPAGGAYASQFMPSFVAANHLDPKLVNQLHIGLNCERANVPFAVAHELGHQLTNRGDVATADHIFFQTTGAMPGDGTTVLRKRRMTNAIDQDARTRNTLLRNS